MDKISIVVPIYNVEKYLDQCVKSIINQTYKNLEIILVNDGIIDNSGKICDKYKRQDNRVIVIHKENGGASDARNVGIQIATGKYIGFVDSDDYIEKDMYEFLYNNMINENADISCCNRFLVWSNKKQIYGKKNYYTVMNSKEAIEQSCEIGYIGGSAYTKLYKKELFKNIRYPKGKTAEDMYTMYKLFDKANKIVYDATPKYYYRQRKGSVTNSKKISTNALEATKEMIEFIKIKYPSIEKNAIKNYLYTAIGVYDTIIKVRTKDRMIMQLKKDILKDVKIYYPIIKKDRNIMKSRKIQLFLLEKSTLLYNCVFLIYDKIKNHIKVKD